MSAKTTDEGLKRVIGVPALAAAVVNITIGSGIYVLPGIVCIQLGAAGKVITDYKSRDWSDFVTHYSDSAKILIHLADKDAINATQLSACNKEDATSFTDWKYRNKKLFMLTNDKGETWVYFNGLWQGTFIPINKLYEIPAQINVLFVNGKIEREEGYWDISNVMLDNKKMEDSTTTK